MLLSLVVTNLLQSYLYTAVKRALCFYEHGTDILQTWFALALKSVKTKVSNGRFLAFIVELIRKKNGKNKISFRRASVSITASNRCQQMQLRSFVW